MMKALLKELLHSILICSIAWYFGWTGYGANLGIYNFILMVIFATGFGLLIKKWISNSDHVRLN